MAATLSLNTSSSPTRRVIDQIIAADPVVRRGKLLYKLLGIFLSLSVASLLLIGFQLIRVGNNYIQKQIIGVKLGIAQKVASNVWDYIQDKKNTLQIVHKSTDFLTMESRRQNVILSNVMNAYPMFMRMAVIDLNGREVSSLNRVGQTSQADRLEEEQALKLIRSMGEYIGPVSRSADGYPQMTLGVPIERIPGRPIGVLLGVVNLLDLSSFVKDLAIDKKGYVYIIDMAQKRLVAHPVLDTVLSQDPPEIRAAALVPDDRANGALELEQNGTRFLATFATVRHLNWCVFVQQPTEEAYAASQQMRREFIKVLILVILVTLTVGVFISRRIVARVHRLQAAMEQVGEGNFDVPHVPSSNDEFGSLTDKFLWMANSLKDKTLKLVSAQRELQRWNSDLEKRVQERTRDLKEAQEQLIVQEKLAVLGQMASVVGHELRNPLAVMNNSVYFLKTKLLKATASAGVEDELDPKIQKHLNIIEAEITKSNTIIRDILDFARNRALHLAPHAVDELVEKAIERIAIPTSVTLHKDLRLAGIQVPLDEDEIRQVLVNLMENACQAMTSGGRLTVGTKAYKDDVEIRISDTGCGIPQEHLSKIFAPFFTTKSRGTGLGLAVVKKIVERHQGTMTVQSTVGEGTTFIIKLPLRGPNV